MITTFEVGSIFKIVDRASPALRTILKGTTELDAAVEAARKNLTGLARTRLVGVNNQFGALTKEVLGFDKALGGAVGSIGKLAKASGALAEVNSAIAGTSATVKFLADDWRAVAVSAGEAASAMRSAGRVKSPSFAALTTGTDAALANARILADVWARIAAEVSTAAAGARVLGTTRLPALPGAPGPAGALPPPARGSVPAVPPPPLGRPPRGGGRHGPRQGWHLGTFGGSIPVAGGHVHASTPSSGAGIVAGASLFGVYELAKQAVEPMHQEAMLKLLNIPEPTIGKMSTEARDIAYYVPGSGYSKNMQNMGELYSIVGAEGAMEIAPKLAEIDRVQSIVGGKGKDQGSAYTLTRATELMGKLTDPMTHKVDIKLFGDIIDNMSKMSIASHGKVTPEEWLNYAKQAGPAAGNLTVEGLYTTSAIIQAMGGNRAGTAAAAVQRQFAGGVMTKSKAEELTNIGIFKPGDYEVGKGGHVSFVKDAGKSFVDKLQKDPLNAVVQDLIPALESHGFKTNEEITKELYKILGTAPEQREIYEIIRGREQIHQERERAMQALPPGAALTTLGENDPTMVTSAFSTAFKDLLGALGSPLMKDAIPGISALTTALNALSASAAKHENVTGIATSTAAGASIGTAIGFLLGWLGGPFAGITVPAGMAGGALIGGGIGAAWGAAGAITNYMAPPKQSFDGSIWPNPNKDAGSQTGGFTPMGGLEFGGMGPDFSKKTREAGDAAKKDAAWNVVPPPQKLEIAPGKVSLNIDGRTLGEVAVSWMVREGNGPAQGSPYPDTSRGGSSIDFALV